MSLSSVLTLGHRYRADELLPQSQSLILLDEIDSYGSDWLRAIVVMGPGKLFFVPQRGVPGWIGLEYIAQTAAAYGGIEVVQRGQRPGIGFLMGCREYRCDVEYFAPGQRLSIEAHLVLRNESDFVAYDCSIASSAATIARTILKAYRPEDVQTVIREQTFG